MPRTSPLGTTAAFLAALAASTGCASPGQSAIPPVVRAGSSPEIVSVILLRKAACDRARPGFRDRSARAFARWRKFGGSSIEPVENSAQFQARLADAARLAPPLSPADRSQTATYCGDDFIEYLDRLGRDPDPRMSTPQRTWAAFVGAMQQADRKTALAFMTDTAREHQQRRFDAQSDATLQTAADSFVSLTLREPLGPYLAAAATRRDGTTVTVFFELSWNGDWRLASV
jgi:hypothetical protein